MAQDRLAVLIDADNAQADLIEPLLAEIAKFGVASVKRIYGDWTLPNLGSWKQRLVEHAIQPMQQFRYTTGKNATDSALIIDAMDLLYTGNFEGFCLVSSDSDFTRLATRLREAGRKVYGFGERKTPRSLIAACDKFVYVDVLKRPGATSVSAAAVPKPVVAAKAPVAEPAKKAAKPAAAAVAAPASVPTPAPATKPKPDEKLVAWLREAVEASEGEDGRAPLGAVGNLLSKQAPDFDSRTYGFKKLSELFASLDAFVMDTVRSPEGGVLSHYVRLNKPAS